MSTLSAATLAAVLEHVDELILAVRADGTITFVSPSVRRLLGWDPEDTTGRNIVEFLHPDDVDELINSLLAWSHRRGRPDGEPRRTLCADGSWRWLHYDVAAGPEVHDLGDVVIISRPAEDVDHRDQELVQRTVNEERLVRLASAFLEVGSDQFDLGLERAVAELAGLKWVTRVSVWTTTGDRLHRRAVWTSKAFAPTAPLPSSSAIALMPRVASLEEIHIHSLTSSDRELPGPLRSLRDAGVVGMLIEPIAVAGRFAGVVVLEHTWDEGSFGASHFSTVRSAAGILGQAFARHDAELELERRASIDSLTGLANRWTFEADLVRALQEVRAGRSPGVAVTLIDIDRFKLVNDSFGHQTGDRLIAEVGRRCATFAATDGQGTIARLHGDEFLLLHPSCATPEEARARTVELVEQLRPPFDGDDQPIALTVSAGVAQMTTGEGAASELLRYADRAMYQAKRLGGDQVRLDDRAQGPIAERLRHEAELRNAVETGELTVHFQGEWDLLTQQLVGAEALARWNHPRRGLLPAGEFIPLAEESGIVDALGAQVLRSTCEALADWRSQGLAAPPLVRVNISARQLRRTELVDEISEAIQDCELEPERLCLELTESALLADPEGAAAALRKVRDLGVGLAVDDFGTGYSSFLYLKRLPITSLKIDRAFVAGLPDDPMDRAIVSSVVRLADELGIGVTAEGVETHRQRDALLDLGCSLAQGFWLSEPEPAQVFATRLIA